MKYKDLSLSDKTEILTNALTTNLQYYSTISEYNYNQELTPEWLNDFFNKNNDKIIFPEKFIEQIKKENEKEFLFKSICSGTLLSIKKNNTTIIPENFFEPNEKDATELLSKFNKTTETSLEEIKKITEILTYLKDNNIETGITNNNEIFLYNEKKDSVKKNISKEEFLELKEKNIKKNNEEDKYKKTLKDYYQLYLKEKAEREKLQNSYYLLLNENKELKKESELQRNEVKIQNEKLNNFLDDFKKEVNKIRQLNEVHNNIYESFENLQNKNENTRTLLELAKLGIGLKPEQIKEIYNDANMKSLKFKEENIKEEIKKEKTNKNIKTKIRNH